MNNSILQNYTVVILHSEIIDPTRADELDTLEQVREVKLALQSLNISTVEHPFISPAELCIYLATINNPLVFNLVESISGRADNLHFPPLLLEQLQIPFTGNHSNALYQTTNKIFSKLLMNYLKIPTPCWCNEDGEIDGTHQYAAHDRYIVKPVSEEGSFGINRDSIVEGYAAAKKLITSQTEKYGGKWFAEGFIAGREFNISVMEAPEGVRVLPLAEIKFGEGHQIVTYEGKWSPEHPDYSGTERSFDTADATLNQKLTQLALDCWHGFDLKGYARMDVRVDLAGNPWILEVNANPCLTSDAGFAAAAKQAGVTYTKVVEWLVITALKS